MLEVTWRPLSLESSGQIFRAGLLMILVAQLLITCICHITTFGEISGSFLCYVYYVTNVTKSMIFKSDSFETTL